MATREVSSQLPESYHSFADNSVIPSCFSANRPLLILMLVLLSLFLFLTPGIGNAGQVTLAWDMNSEPNVTGYKIYYGTASRNYDWVIDVGKVTEVTITDLPNGATYYFAATAYDNSNPPIESEHSDEVNESMCTYLISPVNASFNASGGTGSVSVTTEPGCTWTASSVASWMTITSGKSGKGSGTIGYSVSANATTDARTTSSTFAKKVFTVTQSGAAAHTITVSTGTGGTISPSGAVTVAHGASQTFTITPNAGYQISNLMVDGSSVAPVGSYTFSNVTTNHTISATFSVKTYTITTSAGTGGSISPAGSISVPHGGGQTFTITPSMGYSIANVKVDGVSKGAISTYAFNKVTANHTISVTFSANSLTVTASAGVGGTISPSGKITVTYGDSKTFSITADPGYTISDVLVDGSSVGAVNSYTFSNVASNHTIVAKFDVISLVPVITSQAVTTATVEGLYTYDVNATGNPVPSYSLVTYPLGMTIHENTGLIQWTPTQKGSFDVVVKTSNSLGTDMQSFKVNVSDPVKIWIEAEHGTLGSPMRVELDDQASSGEYVCAPNGVGDVTDPLQVGGYVQYTFNVPMAGDYVVWGRVMVDTQRANDSFFVSMDSGPHALWATPFGSTESWQWDLVSHVGGADPVVYGLAAGQHTLVVKQREDGTKIDRILITNDMSYVPEERKDMGYTLTVATSGNGSGRIIANPSATAYAPGTKITLKAVADDGSRFDGFSGDCTSNKRACTFTINQDSVINALFELKSFKVRTTTVGNGTVSVDELVSNQYSKSVKKLSKQAKVKRSKYDAIISYGGQLVYRINPDPGYYIKKVDVDGKRIETVDTVVFPDIKRNHRVVVRFESENKPTSRTAAKASGKKIILRDNEDHDLLKNSANIPEENDDEDAEKQLSAGYYASFRH